MKLNQAKKFFTPRRITACVLSLVSMAASLYGMSTSYAVYVRSTSADGLLSPQIGAGLACLVVEGLVGILMYHLFYSASTRPEYVSTIFGLLVALAFLGGNLAIDKRYVADTQLRERMDRDDQKRGTLLGGNLEHLRRAEERAGADARQARRTYGPNSPEAKTALRLHQEAATAMREAERQSGEFAADLKSHATVLDSSWFAQYERHASGITIVGALLVLIVVGACRPEVRDRIRHSRHNRIEDKIVDQETERFYEGDRVQQYIGAYVERYLDDHLAAKFGVRAQAPPPQQDGENRPGIGFTPPKQKRH